MTMVFLDSGSTSPWTVPTSFSYQFETLCADTSAQASAFYFNFGQNASQWRRGQTFTTTAAVDIDWVAVLMSTNGTGNPGGPLYCTIYDSTFSTVLGISNPVSADDVSNYGLGQFLDFTFNKPITLANATTYAFSIHSVGTVDGSNFFRNLGDQINFYAGGAMYDYDGYSWGLSGSGWDTTFKIGKKAHTVELLGPGGFGAAGTTGTSGNGGGGGGGSRYLKLTWASSTYGSTVPFLVPSGGTNNHTQWQSSVANTGNFYQAGGGQNASGITGGAAGTATTTVGSPSVLFNITTNNAGGAGGTSGVTRGGGGGAAAGGPHGTGKNGGSVTTTGWGGGGGGGADGGTAGANPTSATFAAGGNGWNGTGANTNGGSATGDAGGAGSTTTTLNPVAAGNGGGSSGGFYWSDNNVFGNCGGGGGSGGSTQNGNTATTAGSAGGFGAGGGGTGYARGSYNTNANGGAGTGLIVLNYIARSGANNSGPPATFATATTAIDAGTNPKDTPLFNVRAGDVIVAAAMCESGNDGTNNCVIDISVSGGSATIGSWTLEKDTAVLNANNPYLRVWTAPVTADGNVQLRFNRSSSSGLRFLGFANWYRWTDGVGASVRNDNGTGAGSPTATLTTTQINSAVQSFVVDKNAVSGTPTATTSEAGGTVVWSLIEQSGAGVQSCEYGAFTADCFGIGTTTMGMSAPTGQRYVMTMVEIKGLALAPTVAGKAPPVFSQPRRLWINRRF